MGFKFHISSHLNFTVPPPPAYWTRKSKVALNDRGRRASATRRPSSIVHETIVSRFELRPARLLLRMRVSLRLLAKVQAGKLLEVDAPTGLTGILTHPQPRSALVYTYNQTLSKLQALPKSSVYRQSTEAITKSRLKIIQHTRPAGYEEWLSRVKAQVDKNPAAYSDVMQKDGSIAFSEPFRTTSDTWDGQPREVLPEGAYSEESAKLKGEAVEAEDQRNDTEEPPSPSELEPEPPLDSDQINDVENKIGAGLIEEVIMVAEGELALVDEMVASKVWEPLEEKAAPGQWEYFERGTHTGTT